MMNSVLVTGATGFIGRHTLQPLLNKGFTIYALFSEGKPVLTDSNIFWHQINLHDASAAEKLLHDITPTHLLHLAWFAKPNEYWNSFANLDWLSSSLSLLTHFIKINGKRIVFAGSCAEYDWQHPHCDELLTPCIPKTLYGRAKYSLYLLSDAIAQQKNISFAWGRLFYLFGQHEYPERLIPSAINHFRNRENFHVMNGHQVRDFMYVKDVADALVALLDSDVQGPVNIASGQALAISELVLTIAKKLDAEAFVHFSNLISKEEPITADVTRLSREINWRPHYSLDLALDETIRWWDGKI